MRSLFAFVLVLSFSFVAEAQYTLIPDSAFEAKLIELGIDSEGTHDGQVLTSDAQATTTLKLANAGITDLSGIEDFTSLTTFWPGYNDITSMDLSALTLLTDLRVTSTLLTSIDVSANTQLQTLYVIASNGISEIDLSNNPDIRYLLLGENELTSIDVTGLPELRWFHINGNPISSIDISQNPLLNDLRIDGTLMTSVDLSNSPELEDLRMFNMGFTQLDLSNNPELVILEIGGNALTSLDISNNLSLVELFAFQNELTSLDLSQHVFLERLNISSNQLTELNLKNGSNLNFQFAVISSNPDLACVEVDDPVYAESNFIYDETTSFSDDCSNTVDCSVFDTAPVDLTKSFDPVGGVEDRVQVKWFKASPQVRYSDEDAAMCDIKFWPKRDLDPVTGNPVGPAYVAPDTTFINDKVKTHPDGSPREIFKWPIKYRADGANNAKRAEPNIRYEWQVRCECGHDGNGQESPWSDIKIFNTPDFDPATGINGSPSVQGEAVKRVSEYKASWSIAPNPNSGESLSIIWDAPDENGFRVRLLDLTGKLVLDQQVPPSKGRVQILDLPQGLETGVYLVQCTVNGVPSTKRLMIQ